ncbi:bacterio-opsin activator domain-containing protein [Halogeometricum luteum]|uniref:Helix-turn-helix domain-containing protein n=1 Tax=Halogeometricum luteum TaxID=2950537 RepID=A0ABU2FWZ0_9EURY|nr:helix-turn-helix domain-containing protein [Halogeometricum sp. S3BR5-2]MDS0293052.1 helix-turn-helix domain-containing protein [Halogeometricum sp. S3BR5-2]
MSVVAQFVVPTDSFALSEAAAAHPEAVLEAERLATHSPEWALPFLWASGPDLAAFAESMRADPTVDGVECIEDAGRERLYRVEWSDGVLELISEMINRHAVVSEAVLRGGEWRLTVRFSRDEQVSAFRDHFERRGRTFDVERIYHPTAPRGSVHGLTRQQRETLRTASREGYFEIPRRLSMQELAEKLGLSSNAVSQRIRRGTGNLVRNTLTVGPDDERADDSRG